MLHQPDGSPTALPEAFHRAEAPDAKFFRRATTEGKFGLRTDAPPPSPAAILRPDRGYESPGSMRNPGPASRPESLPKPRARPKHVARNIAPSVALAHFPAGARGNG